MNRGRDEPRHGSGGVLRRGVWSQPAAESDRLNLCRWTEHAVSRVSTVMSLTLRRSRRRDG